jgi:hypothetical protein
MRRDLGVVGGTALMLLGWLLIGTVMGGCGSKSSSSSTTQTTTVATTTPTSTPLPVTTTTSQVNVGLGSYLPLWPFATSEQARAWEESNSSGGHQVWHLDAGLTAHAFVTGYLGFTEIDTVIHTTVDPSGAHVAIGFVTAGTSTSTAAVIHMVPWGTSPGAPWEVVGTDDTTLVLTTPAYGSTAISPVTAGGTITGVDEHLVATVRQSASSAPLGVSAGVPAGGIDTPWSTTVSYHGATEPVLAIVVQTGGHIQAVERFAITGIRKG